LPDRVPVVELLSALSAVLERQSIRWFLFGAQAVALWGRPRMSADVDVTAVIEPSRVAAFVEAMKEAGFELRVRSEIDKFVARTRVLPFLHLPARLPLDLVLAGPGLEEEFLARAHLVDLAGTMVPVISAEDLVVTKILAGRPKDLEDVSGILSGRRGSLDLELIRATLRLLEGALAQSDLLPLFEAELRRA
jgi:hypothetical protein